MSAWRAFILKPDPQEPTQPIHWGRSEELRIHSRMFDPDRIPPQDAPLPEDLWPVAITITLSPAAPSFEERPEYYQSETNPAGLDSSRWKVWGADFSSSVLFETQGDTDYQVIGSQYFVVAQDLSLIPGAPGSMLLYRWQDLGSFDAKEESSWTAVKKLYF